MPVYEIDYCNDMALLFGVWGSRGRCLTWALALSITLDAKYPWRVLCVFFLSPSLVV